MKFHRPKGITIFRHARTDDPRYLGQKFFCTIKSRGHTGAALRGRLMRLSDEQRDPILREWVAGGVAEL